MAATWAPSSPCEVARPTAITEAVESARRAQRDWAARPIRRRLGVLRELRHRIAENARCLADPIKRPGRTMAESIASEVLPLLEAIGFLERDAAALLRPKCMGRRRRPVWLFGTDLEIRREPHGVVLVVGPANYPLMLPGIQAVQALTAGNAVLIKPAPGHEEVAAGVVELAVQSGVPCHGIQAIPGGPGVVGDLIDAGIDHLVLTGSADTGTRVLLRAAERPVSCTMELSGHDAAFILPGADVDLAARAIAFGLTLNRGDTCIAPHRIFVARELVEAFEARLRQALCGRELRSGATDPLHAALIDDALAHGAGLLIRGATPVVLTNVPATAEILRTEAFGPIAAVVPVASPQEALEFAKQCPYALGASVFGPDAAARELAELLNAGVVTINDLIVPTADPRLPFAGRGRSGFGVTRGAEGLLAMTRVKAIARRRGTFRPHFDQPQPGDDRLFLVYIAVAHGRTLRARLAAATGLMRSLARRGSIRDDL